MIPWYKPSFWGKEKHYVVDALESTWISDGEYINKFESTLADVLNTAHVITTSNGTTSLMLAYLALGLGPGDEIIIPGFTFAAPANMALAIGATPVFADVDADTWLLCPTSVEQKISASTKAIVAVHIYGNVCDMDALRNIADKHGLWLIEDVAEALFSTYRNRQAGTFGDIGAYSFQATKTITTGEGGAICTLSDDLQHTARLIRNHGMDGQKRYWHHAVGHNFRLTNIQAALGYAQLEQYDNIIDHKKRVYQRYRQNLNGHKGILLQQITPGCEPVMWAIVVKIEPSIFGMSRDALIDSMLQQGIETRPGFYAFSDMPLYNAEHLVHSSDIAQHTISLPSYTTISADEIDQVCALFLTLKQQSVHDVY